MHHWKSSLWSMPGTVVSRAHNLSPVQALRDINTGNKARRATLRFIAPERKVAADHESSTAFDTS
jgi:hypothetical protein